MTTLILGANGLVGSAIKRKLQNSLHPTSKELNLLDSSKVSSYFNYFKPNKVYLAAAKVGGIHANNTYPADFIYKNLIIQNNVINQCFKHNSKLLFLGSSCIYPKNCLQPIKEEYLLTGPLEETNKAYAIAKIAGIELCQSYNKQYGTNFICAMPTNIYGINDNFDLENSHVLPALIKKIHHAKTNETDVLLWGDGSPRREFLNSDDLAEACIFLMENYNSSEIINVGTGVDLTILDLANLISSIVGFKGNISFDKSKPNGTFQKRLDVSKINKLGWSSKIDLEKGISTTYNWFLRNIK